MRFLLIACEVLTREVCHCVARSPHIMDLQFTPRGAHDDPDYMRGILQEKIDACENSDIRYDAILLCFGLCGNAVQGLQARSFPLVIPRAHDCCTLFLGSKERFAVAFGQRQSCPFQAAGYMERGAFRVRAASRITDKAGFNTNYREYVEKYGEENAKLIWETLHPAPKDPAKEQPVIFIDVPETGFLGYADICRRQAQNAGREFIRLEGSIHLVESLIFGSWPDAEFLVVRPGHQISAVYDWDRIMEQRDA